MADSNEGKPSVQDIMSPLNRFKDAMEAFLMKISNDEKEKSYLARIVEEDKKISVRQLDLCLKLIRNPQVKATAKLVESISGNINWIRELREMFQRNRQKYIDDTLKRNERIEEATGWIRSTISHMYNAMQELDRELTVPKDNRNEDSGPYLAILMRYVLAEVKQSLEILRNSAVAQSIENDREKLVPRLADLVTVTADPHHRAPVVLDLDIGEFDDEEEDVMFTTESLIESLKAYAREYKNARMGQLENDSAEPEEYMHYTGDELLDRIIDVAHQVIGLKDFMKNP